MSRANEFLKKLGTVTGTTYSKEEFAEIITEVMESKQPVEESKPVVTDPNNEQTTGDDTEKKKDGE